VRAYLDHAATTPMLPEAVEAMLPYLSGTFGNPSGSHEEARRARRAVDDAREQVAGLVGADLGEVVFTGSGTEADNLAVTGVLEAAAAVRTGGRPAVPGPVVCSAMEHHAVLEACRATARRLGVELREVPTDPRGLVDLEALAEACTPDVSLVSVMAVNNEIGTVQPLPAVARLVRRRSPDARLHTDAVQAAPWLDLADLTALADLTTLSAHKFGGPKGVGVLVVRDGVRLEPVVRGGGQERERRSGTHDVPGIVAAAAALALTVARRREVAGPVAGRRDRLVDGLLDRVPGSSETGDRADKVPGHAHLCIDGIDGEELVILLDDAGIASSAGAACSSGAVAPSHVLVSMGMDKDAARSGIRLTLGATTTDDEVDRVLDVVPGLVDGLRH
jgi:cysteine desulfurase